MKYQGRREYTGRATLKKSLEKLIEVQSEIMRLNEKGPEYDDVTQAEIEIRSGTMHLILDFVGEMLENAKEANDG